MMNEALDNSGEKGQGETWRSLEDILRDSAPPAGGMSQGLGGVSGWVPLEYLLELQARREWIERWSGSVDWAPLDDYLKLQAEKEMLGLD